MNQIQAAAETGRGDRETRRTRQWLEGILCEGDRVANMVRDLLSFARVEKEASPVHVSDIFRVTRRRKWVGKGQRFYRRIASSG